VKEVVSVVIPTKNEEANIVKLLSQIPSYYQKIIVDDSSDDTAIVASHWGAKIVKGKGKGLGQAILDGIEAAKSEIVVVMDADLSHEPSKIHSLVKMINEEGYDLAIGSRYVPGGESVGWELSRRMISRCACLLALPITSVKDATSGFFAFRKSMVKDVKLEASSWKIMLEILLKCKPTRVVEVPISFVVRKEGKSKFNRKQMIAYLEHLVKLAFWKYQKFIKFCIVGGIGAGITFGLTWALTERIGLWYMASLLVAVLVATVSNFTLNTFWTFKIEVDQKAADYEWNSFYKGGLVQKWWKQSIAKTVWSWMPNASSLLDVGCGSSPIITGYYGENIFGIDANEEKLAFMKKKCPRHKFSSLPISEFKDGSLDHILCIEVLEHIQYPEVMIIEIANKVKNGGQVILATPDYSKPLWKLAEAFTPYKEEHVFQFTRESLENMCSKYGLKPIRHKYIATCDLVEEFVKCG